MKTSFKRFMSLVLVVLTLVACCAPAISAASTECDHKYDPNSEPILHQDPTCQELGYDLYWCIGDCKKAFVPKDKWIARIDHKYTVPGTDLDCTKTEGKEWMECEFCGEKDPASIKNVTGTGDHVWTHGEGFNCEVGGELTCSRCGEKENYKGAHKEPGKYTDTEHNDVDLDCCKFCGWKATPDHVYTTTITEYPSCIDGKMTFTCNCGEKFDVRIEKIYNGITEHKPGAVKPVADKAASCTEDGWKNREQCEICGYVTKTTDIGKFNHMKEDGITSAYELVPEKSFEQSCVQDGYDTYKCSRCGIEEQRDFAGKLGHMEMVNNWITPHDHANKGTGVAYVVCSRLGCEDFAEGEYTLPFSDYKRDESGKAIFENGRYVYVEEVYNNFDNVDFYNTYYHSKDKQSTVVFVHALLPTCTEYGIDYELCKVCGWTGRTREVEPLEHTWINKDKRDPMCGAPGWNAHQECEVCHIKSDNYQETSAGEHDKSTIGSTDANKYKAPICGVAGFYHCSKCKQNVEIEALKHDYVIFDEVPANCLYPANYVWKCQRECCAGATLENVPVNDSDNVTTNATWKFDVDGKGSFAETNYANVKAGNGTEINTDPITGHNVEIWYTTKPATCFAAGDEYGTCTRCSKNDIYHQIPILTHTAFNNKDVDTTTYPELAGLTYKTAGDFNAIKVADIPATFKKADGTVDLEKLISAGITAVEYPASCTKFAYIMYACIYMADDKSSHHWFEKTVGDEFQHTYDPDNANSFVSAGVDPTCTEVGYKAKWVCVTCGEVDPERDGSEIPSHHAVFAAFAKDTLMGNEYSKKLKVAVPAGFKFVDPAAPTCNGLVGDAHADAGTGRLGYFDCLNCDGTVTLANPDGIDGAFVWHKKLNKYVFINLKNQADADMLKVALTNYEVADDDANYAIHCATKGCTKCGVGASEWCFGNGWENATKCNLCNNTIESGNVIDNPKVPNAYDGASGLIQNNNRHNGGWGHMGYVKINKVDATCYSAGVTDGWKCTECNVKYGGNTQRQKTHTDVLNANEVNTYTQADFAYGPNNYCIKYEFELTICKWCDEALTTIAKETGFNSAYVYNDTRTGATKQLNKIVLTKEPVEHMNADGIVLPLEWTCEEAKAALDKKEFAEITDADLTCDECGTYKTAINHIESATVNKEYPAKCNENGYKTTVCEKDKGGCGTEFVTEITEVIFWDPAKEEYVYIIDPLTGKRVGDAYHKWEKYDTVASTEFENGYDIEKCAYCEETRNVANGDTKKDAFTVKVEVVPGAVVKGQTFQVKITLVNLLDKDLPVQGVQVEFPVSRNLIYRGVEFNPVEGFGKDLAKVEAYAANGVAKFIMNTYSDKEGNKNNMLVPAGAKVEIATITFIVSDTNRTAVDLACTELVKVGGTGTEATVLKEVEDNEALTGKAYGVKIQANNADSKVYLLGDVNKDGTVNVTDSQVLADLLIAQSPDDLEGDYVKALDVNKDGKITTRDLWLIQQYIVTKKSVKDFYNEGLLDGEKWGA